MENIAIYGAGGFGREVACLINAINKVKPTWNMIGFYDDTKEIGDQLSYGPILGGMNELNAREDSISVVIAVGSPAGLRAIYSKITNPLVKFPNIVHPSVDFFDESSLQIGQGNVICAGSIISCDVKLGNFNVINISFFIGHDSILGDFNAIMPAVKISGNVKVGNSNYFGVASVVIHQTEVGSETTIGAGCVIIRKTKDSSTYFGNPSKIIY